MITDDKIIEVCNSSQSMSEASMILDIPFTTFKRRSQKLGWYKTNQVWNKGKSIFDDNRVSINNLENIFILDSSVSISKSHKNKLKKILGENCSKCKRESIWEGSYLEMELDHINGDNTDNRLENLRFLCPNCHSQTETFRGRNIKKNRNKDGFYKYTISELFKGVESSGNLSDLCRYLNIKPSGGNYETLKKKMIEYNLSFGTVVDLDQISKKEIDVNKCKCGNIISKSNILCVKCAGEKQRRVNRPCIEVLLSEIEELGGYAPVGRKYGVSGNSVKKWILSGS